MAEIDCKVPNGTRLTMSITEAPANDFVSSTNGFNFPLMTISSNAVTLLGTAGAAGVTGAGAGGAGGGGGGGAGADAPGAAPDAPSVDSARPSTALL